MNATSQRVTLCLCLLYAVALPAMAQEQPRSASVLQLFTRAAPAHRLVDGYPLRDRDGTVLAGLTLRVAAPVVASNGQLQLEWTLTNIGHRQTYFNPGLRYRVVPSGEILLFGQNGQDHSTPRGEGSFWKTAPDWITLDPGEGFSTRRTMQVALPPGRYCIQLVYWKRLLEPLPGPGLPALSSTRPADLTEEVIRSNPVWFEVVAP